MKQNELIERALSQVGLGTSYVLGGGDLRPDDATAMDKDGGCDCSAFVCWCLRTPKIASGFKWLRKVNGGWYNTDGMWWDACVESTGLFEKAKIAPGAILVYPSSKILAAAGWSDSDESRKAWGGEKGDGFKPTPRIGHVGIVVSGDSWENARVVHCSAGNDRKFGDAIQVTGPEVFRVRSAVSAWCVLVEQA